MSLKSCAVCGVANQHQRCSRCKSVYYCSKEHQQQHWPTHKTPCREYVAAAATTTSTLTQDEQNLHRMKSEFDEVVARHNLHSQASSEKVADLFSRTHHTYVSAEDCSKELGIPIEDSQKLLSWMQVGLDFKEKYMDPHNNQHSQ